jgi:hypothetical protein
MEGGSLLEAGAPFWPQGFPSLADVLESEANRLNDVSANCKQVFNYKRLGVSGTHLWLVNLQEFVAAWTEQELGKSRLLQIEEIASLIQAGEVALGRDSNLRISDPELIGKAIRNFRHNPANAQLFGENGIKSKMLLRCQQVKEHPYLVGIEI